MKDLLINNDQTIMAFFKDARLQGQFSPRIPDYIPDELAQHMCGVLSAITVNGQHNPLFRDNYTVLVPNNFESDTEPGLCDFKAQVNLPKLKRTGKLSLKLTSITPSSQTNSSSIEGEELSKFMGNLKLKDRFLVGRFTRNQDGSFAISDLRRTAFSRLILQNNKPQPPISFLPQSVQPKEGMYYQFGWLVEKGGVDYSNCRYDFKVDPGVRLTPMWPVEIIKRLYYATMNLEAGASQKLVKSINTLKTQLTASGKEIFIYELLQNANDYPIIGDDGARQKVDVEFHITGNSLLFMHTGAKFNEANVAALCDINDQDKSDNKEAIGYKGIGFKTVFLDSEYVYLQSGGFSFRFDREHTRNMVDSPWQILPVWTEYQELLPAEKRVFANASDDFRVRFSLRPANPDILRRAPWNYEKMFSQVFKNERIILFIPNIASVKVFRSGAAEPYIDCRSQSDNWRVDHFDQAVSPETTRAINAIIEEQEKSGALKIPEKYKDFEKTRVSFACCVEQDRLKPVEDAQIYCYLPTKASWGFDFLMNSDLIPTGPRDDIEVDFGGGINFNAEIAAIAGGKLFDWIIALCDSGKYNLDSIFSLVPDFSKCVREHGKYSELIERFRHSFAQRLRECPVVPTERGYQLLTNTVLDETGLTSSEVMDDEDFLRMAGLEGKSLPLKALRASSSFRGFLSRYLELFEAKQTNSFTYENLHGLVHTDDFSQWLAVPENNQRFLKFLLDKGRLGEFVKEPIFIDEESGQLLPAKSLYYDVDSALADLQAFHSLMPRLSQHTLRNFRQMPEWVETISRKFKEFEPDKFVNNVLLGEGNRPNTLTALHQWDTSLHFYKFLAQQDLEPNRLPELPFFDINRSVVPDFANRFVFLPDEEGADVCRQKWLSDVPIAFLSPDYGQDILDYMVNHAGVREFSNDTVAKEMILSEDWKDRINQSQQSDTATSVEFVSYCREHRALFPAGSLKDYALAVTDGQGNGCFVMAEDHVFFDSDYYRQCAARPWIEPEWMHCLDSSYGNDEFPARAFGVVQLDSGAFYHLVVRPNVKAIISKTSGHDDPDGTINIDFVAYLDANYELVFEGTQSQSQFAGFVLLGQDTERMYDIPPSSPYLYACGREVKEMVSQPWMPQALVHICCDAYGDSRAVLKLGARGYDFRSFFVDVIARELDAINKAVDTCQKSQDFHSCMAAHKAELSDNEKASLLHSKVWLLGSDEPAQSAGGHKILTAQARKLLELGLVSQGDLDLIDPAYAPEKDPDYWVRTLGNEKFKVGHFLSWLGNNAGAFARTLRDPQSNISFWRWAKKNLADSELESLPALPVITVGGGQATSVDAIYLSDPYLPQSPIESIVRKYSAEARFISPDYLKSGDDATKWAQFWGKLGVLSEIYDILTHDIIPRLADIDDKTLVAQLARHRERLEQDYTDLPSALAQLRVKCVDGQFLPVGETILVDCEDTEPFRFIHASNQAKFATKAQHGLVKDIILRTQGRVVETLEQWRIVKIQGYLQLQEQGRAMNIHFSFVQELAAIHGDGKFTDSIRKALAGMTLLDSTAAMCPPSSLTLGSTYRPQCDFQAHGASQLSYLSDDYTEHCGPAAAPMFADELHVHADFTKDDVPLLDGNRQLATYFWEEYLNCPPDSDRARRVDKMIKEGLFNRVACIPTASAVKVPGEIYHPSLSKFVSRLPGGPDKLPATPLPQGLPMMKALRFIDCLEALRVFAGTENRRKILSWALADFGHDPHASDEVAAYRKCPEARWNNVRNEPVHISELYALDSGNSKLKQYFEGCPRIISPDSFPDDFGKACEMLGIPTITEDDLLVQPCNPISEPKARPLWLHALAAAGIEGREGWKERHRNYKVKLEQLQLFKCDAISLCYKKDPQVSQTLRRFHCDGCRFYYVDSLINPLVFKDFVEDFKKYLGISLPSDLLGDIMFDGALNRVSEHNELLLDQDFMRFLEDLDPKGASKLQGKEAEAHDGPGDDEGPIEGIRRTETQTGAPQPPRTTNHTQIIPATGSPTGGENEHLGPQGTPLQLKSLPPTDQEIDALSKCGIKREMIENSNYLARYRLYQSLKEQGIELEETKPDFVKRQGTLTTHRAADGRRIIALSAARGVMYLSPKVWQGLSSGLSRICVYTNGYCSKFYYIDSPEDLLKLIEKDDVVIKLTGPEKLHVFRELYDGKLRDAQATAYTLVRVAAQTPFNEVFAQYKGGMADDGDETGDTSPY